MASPAVSSWTYSPVPSSSNLAMTMGNHANPNPRSPIMMNNNSNSNMNGNDSNGIASLHNTLSSLSLSGGKGDYISPTSPSDFEENGSMSNGYGQQQQQNQQRPGMPLRTSSAASIQRAIAAIGSGRTGTSPPSSSSAANNHWPSSSNSSSSTTNNTIYQHHQDPRLLAHHGRHSSLNTQPPTRHIIGSHHDNLPGLNSSTKGAEESAAASSSSTSRFALSQPQFNLDHAQLAKSREQRDLDDVDSGQRASATLWMGDLEGWMDESYIVRGR